MEEVFTNISPEKIDNDNMDIIRAFLTTEGIDFTEATVNDCEYAFYLKNKDKPELGIELRYVNCKTRCVNTPSFGIAGVPCDYFGKITTEYNAAGKRLIWIKDFEMTESEDVEQFDGTVKKDYHRKWEVLQSYICSAMGKVHRRIFARDTEIREVISSGGKKINEALPFLKTHCFYGSRGATKTYGLYLKKDKYDLKKGTLVMLMSFGLCFYGNKAKQGHPDTEVIRVGTYTNSQIIGGSSKLLTHFLKENPFMIKKGNGQTFPVDAVTFFVDRDHNNSNSMSALGYKHLRIDEAGIHNYCIKDFSIPGLSHRAGEMFMRMPMFHQEIMQLEKDGYVVPIANAGTDVYELHRNQYLTDLENKANEDRIANGKPALPVTDWEKQQVDAINAYNSSKGMATVASVAAPVVTITPVAKPKAVKPTTVVSSGADITSLVNSVEVPKPKERAKKATAEKQTFTYNGKEINVTSRTILCVETKEIYESASEAGRALNIDPSSIAKCATGKRQKAGGYHWKNLRDLINGVK